MLTATFVLQTIKEYRRPVSIDFLEDKLHANRNDLNDRIASLEKENLIKRVGNEVQYIKQ